MTSTSISPVMLTASLILAGCIGYLVSEAVSWTESSETGLQAPAVSRPAPAQAVPQSAERAAPQTAATTGQATGRATSATTGQAARAWPQRPQPVTRAPATDKAQAVRAEPAEAIPPVSNGNTMPVFPPGVAPATGAATAVRAGAGETRSSVTASPDALPQDAENVVAAPADNDNNDAAQESVQPASTDEGNVYSEVAAEVQIDLDEKQSIRCYPVSSQNPLPCMCEFTIVKEGRVQTELVDNCEQ